MIYNSIFRRLFLFTLLIALSFRIFAEIDYELIVAQDGSGEYTSIGAALNNAKAFPDKRITIQIKNGIYIEKLTVGEWNPKISLIGENKEKTIIRFDDHFKKIDKGRNSTFYTSTVNIQANDITIKNLTIENTAGEVGQAIALSVSGDRFFIENTRILANQDTLYVSGESNRMYFRDTYIEGTTDFIFGNATAFFENCQLHSKKDSYITAASTTENQKFGLVFNSCRLTANKEIQSVYLGRPWRPYAKTVFINSHMGKHIAPEGWKKWNKNHNVKAYYAEYNSSGPGGQTEKRVSWSEQIPEKIIKNYKPKSILVRKNETNWLNQ